MRKLEEDIRPIIMPLCRLVEAKLANILYWTNRKDWSPFGTVKMDVGEEEKEFVSFYLSIVC